MFVFAQVWDEGGFADGGSGTIDGGRGGNAGLYSEGLEPSSTIAKRDDDGRSWPVLLDAILFNCNIFNVLGGSGSVEKVGPAYEMLSSSCPPPNPDNNR